MYRCNIFVYSLTFKGHLTCFYFLAITNESVINICAHVYNTQMSFSRIMLFSPLWSKYPGVECLDQLVEVYLAS